MNTARAGFRMLMILSVVDGKYTQEEGKEIAGFLNHHLAEEIDLDEETNYLLTIPKADLPIHFKRAAQYYFQNSDEASRYDFLAYAYRLVLASGQITLEERRILNALARYWQVDLTPILEKDDEPAA